MLSICFGWLFWHACLSTENWMTVKTHAKGEKWSGDENASYALIFVFVRYFCLAIGWNALWIQWHLKMKLHCAAWQRYSACVFLLYLHFNVSYIYMWCVATCMFLIHTWNGICWFHYGNLLMTHNKQRNYYGEIKPLCVRVFAYCKHMEMNNDSVFKVYGKFIGICLYVRVLAAHFVIFFLSPHRHFILLFFAFNIRIYT